MTGTAGKWHAGYYLKELTPHGRGFDRSLGCEYNNAVSCLPPSRSASNTVLLSIDFECCEDHWTQQSLSVCDRAVDLWETDRPGYGLNGTDYGDFMFFGRAVATIVNHSLTVPRQPLFFYLATQVSHQPVQAPDRFESLFDKATCPSVVEYAMTAVLDEGLGNITSALKRTGMWNSTLFVFSSDNGGLCVVIADVHPTSPGEEGNTRASRAEFELPHSFPVVSSQLRGVAPTARH